LDGGARDFLSASGDHQEQESSVLDLTQRFTFEIVFLMAALVAGFIKKLSVLSPRTTITATYFR
jgi:hypothetical protein